MRCINFLSVSKHGKLHEGRIIRNTMSNFWHTRLPPTSDYGTWMWIYIRWKTYGKSMQHQQRFASIFLLLFELYRPFCTFIRINLYRRIRYMESGIPLKFRGLFCEFVQLLKGKHPMMVIISCQWLIYVWQNVKQPTSKFVWWTFPKCVERKEAHLRFTKWNQNM